ncbi:MAG: DUF6055 domain-containing protein [Deltaproteobacteria bacterium]|jgi:hypothetical protein|nr:DUF6055 domain-containing protein [Deltaproteobacteria bacterium]
MSFFLVLLFSTLLSFNPSFEKVVNRHPVEGKISQREQLNILYNAVVSPEKLSKKWQALLQKSPIEPDQATSILVSVFQNRMKRGFKDDMPGFPQELDYYLDSDTRPLRVYYESPSYEAKAAAVLEAAEYAWDIQIDLWGFYEPLIVTPEDRYRIYLTDSGMGGGGYNAPVSDYPETPRDDCTSYIVIDKSNDEYSISSVTTHEFNHALQGSMDCLEPPVWWENTATYMMVAVYPTSLPYIGYYLPSFQEAPQESISFFQQNGTYQYGGFIWPLYIADNYGAKTYQDAVLIREFWEECIQSSGFSSNVPNYLKAIDNVLQESEQTSLYTVFAEFSKARYFIDSNVSQYHSKLPGANNLNPSPELNKSLNIAVETSYSPNSSTVPKPYGVNYIKLDKDAGYDRSTVVELTNTEGNNPWLLQLVSFNNDTVIFSEKIDGIHTIIYNPAEVGEALLIVQHLGNETFSPDNLPDSGSSYTINIRPEIALPLITFVHPGDLYAGSTQDLTIMGTDFQDNFTLSFVPDGYITVNELTYIDANNLSANITISPDALLGDYSLTITHEDEGTNTKESAINVLENPDTGSPEGCSCQVGKTENSSLFHFLTVLSILGFALRFKIKG